MRVSIVSLLNKRRAGIVFWLPAFVIASHILIAIVAYLAILAGFGGAVRFIRINPWVAALGIAWVIGIVVWRVTATARARRSTEGPANRLT